MANKRIILTLLIVPLVCYVHVSGAQAPNNNGNAPQGYVHARETQAPSNSGDAFQGYGCYFRCLGSEAPNGCENDLWDVQGSDPAPQGGGGWQREVLDWGIVVGSGVGGFIFSKQEPFFENPLISGPGDKPYKEEQVPNSWLAVSMAAAVACASLLPNQDGWLNERSYRHLKGSLLAFSSGLFIKELSKDIVGRPRPDYYDRLARGIEVDEARESWPSGHATHAAGVATYLTLFTWDEWRDDAPLAVTCKSGITALLVAGAAWVGYTRVADNRHYVGDVVAGSILGAGTALLAYSWEQWWGAPKDRVSLGQSLNIQVTPLSIGVRLSF